jgi:dimethylglycine catabolism A
LAPRASARDPDWTLKIASGAGAEVRTCEFTNYCEALDRKHKTVTCLVWDREALDKPGVMRTADGKRRRVAPHWGAENTRAP